MDFPMMDKSLSVVVPVFNEEDNISLALDGIQSALEGLIDDYEIIVINDGSKDRTLSIAQERARRDTHIICISNDRNRGYGYSYWLGVTHARKEFIGVYNGDNEGCWQSFRAIVDKIGQADIISSYTSNCHERPWFRYFLSITFTAMMNGLFGMHLKYFNGLFICKREILQALTIRSEGLTALAECKVRLIKQGYSCLEIPLTYVPRSSGRSTALSLKSIKAVIQAVACIYWDIRGLKK
jgi:glycosyltransferase involved in cell wall biosynthesis